MSRNSFLLRNEVIAEPLINQWYAWPLLIPPVHAAMYVANSHLKVMKSFVANPALHVAALREPGMMGGPFLGLSAEKSGDVRRLIEQTETKFGAIIELAQAVKDLDEMLERENDGTSLEAKYARIPEPLRGYVELVYDIHSRPSARLLERLLYRSPHFLTSWQSIQLSLRSDEERCFVFNTPRLETDSAGGSSLTLRVPFAHAALDELFRMRTQPGEIEPLEEAFRLGPEERKAFRSFFVPAGAPVDRPSWQGPSVRIRYLNHACVLVEGDVSVLIDPVIPYSSGVGGRLGFQDLPNVIDYVLISHAHQDHFVLESLLQLRHKVRTVIVPRAAGGTLADPSLKLVLEAIGFENVVELDVLERLDVSGGTITAMPFLGEHGDLSVAKSAYVVELNGKAIMFAADSNNLDPVLYQHARKATRDVDALFIGMECEGGPMSFMYGGLLTKPMPRRLDQSRRLNASNSQRALALVEQFDPKRVFVYAMGLEPWLTFLTSIVYTASSTPMVESDRFVGACRLRGLAAERLSAPLEFVID